MTNQLPKDWKMVKLGDLGKIVTGTTPPKSNAAFYNSNDISFFKPDDMERDCITNLVGSKDYLSFAGAAKARVVPKNTVFVTCIGIIGKIGITSADACFNQQINAIIPDTNKVHPSYLAYIINHRKKLLDAMANAPIVPIINKSQFSLFAIPLPPLEAQHKIVSILDEADNLRRLRKQADEKMKELIPALFDEMFGDPITNPMGWKTFKFGDVVGKNALQIMPTDFPEKEFTYIGLEHIESNTGNILSVNKEYGRDIKSLKNQFVPGDILYGRLRPYLNKVWQADIDGICSTEILVLQPIKTLTTARYIYTFLKLNPIVDILNSLTEGANLPRVKTSGMNAIKIPIPPLDIQNSFSSMVDDLFSECAKYQSVSESKLDDLFNSLLDRCMSGEIC